MPKKTVTQLYAEFKKALAALDASPYPRRGTGKAKYDALIDLTSELCRCIVETPANPANPIPEILLKIDAAGWGVHGILQPLERWEGTSDEMTCLASLREDLQAMQAAPPRRASRRPERVEAAPSR